jgi:eukaryotic-like serine/threonine-protein kinase
MRLAPGDRLGYEIVSALGVGGMGEVYKATDTRLGRGVAIKILPGAEPDLIARFDREARAVAALAHPHICALYDVGSEPGADASDGSASIRYLVMEHLEGETLSNRDAGGIMAVAVKADSAFEAGALQELFRARIQQSFAGRYDYAVTADGQRFLVNTLVSESRPMATVVLNWAASGTK